MAYDTRELQVKLTGDASDLTKTLANTNKTVDDTGKRTQTSFLKMGAVMGAVSGIAQNVFSRAIDGISGSVGDAVKRVDTLNNANNIFTDMGFKAGDTKTAMDDLKTSIVGLPTSLDQAVSGVELLAGSTNDIGKSQKIFSAMNDAIIGFGGSAGDVQGAIVQLSQAFSNGKIDAQTWNSLIQNGMGPALNAIAKQMGITTGALKDGLSDGTISVQSFQDALIKMDTQGGGGMKSFKETSKDATSGIATGMANAKTAVTRGIADIIQAIGSKNISDAISAIGTDFEKALKIVSKAITDGINDTKDIIKFTKDHEQAIKDVAAAITIFFMPALVKAGALATVTAAKSVAASIVSSTAWIRSAVMTSASFFLEMGKVVASFVLTGTKAVIQATATSASWIASAAASSASWLLEMTKTVAVFTWTALKAAPAALDTSAAWIINAARVSFVWVTTEMPKLVASFAVTSGKAVIEAATTSAAWIASSAKTSFAWVVTELPKIISGFIATSAGATANAAVSSASWIASASASATAWVITELPRIIAAFVAMSGSAVVNAAISSAAWIASAASTSAAWITASATSTQTFGALSALVATPMVMPAIVVTAALASIDAVYQKGKQTLDLLDRMNGEQQQDLDSISSGIQQIEQAADSGKISHAKAADLIRQLGASPKAMGGSVSSGTPYLVGDNPDGTPNATSEIFVPGQSGSIIPAQKTKELMNGGGAGGNTNITVNVGMYAGMPVEKRQIALELYKELVRAARSQGVSLPMIGAVGVQ